jgi:hypothetical protein
LGYGWGDAPEETWHHPLASYRMCPKTSLLLLLLSDSLQCQMDPPNEDNRLLPLRFKFLMTSIHVRSKEYHAIHNNWPLLITKQHPQNRFLNTSTAIHARAKPLRFHSWFKTELSGEPGWKGES